jgi:16S rRNA pseudouridine516 synthase
MMRAVGCKVVYLKRLSIAGVALDEKLPLGEYRPLTDEELERLKSAVADK